MLQDSHEDLRTPRREGVFSWVKIEAAKLPVPEWSMTAGGDLDQAGRRTELLALLGRKKRVDLEHAGFFQA